jgi:hypothetical protein
VNPEKSHQYFGRDSQFQEGRRFRVEGIPESFDRRGISGDLSQYHFGRVDPSLQIQHS